LKRKLYEHEFHLFIIVGQRPGLLWFEKLADLFLAARGTTPTLSVGENWITNFVKRHPSLSSRFARPYNYSRAKCEDAEIIRRVVSLVHKAILQDGIAPDDVYNFDETGLAMGSTATTRAFTRASKSLLQPVNFERVTAIDVRTLRGGRSLLAWAGFLKAKFRSKNGLGIGPDIVNIVTQ
jgi:hypothetical protein